MALQQGVFNVTDNTYGFQVLPSNTAMQNTTNLNGWVNLLLNAGPGHPTNGQGGTLQFPAVGTYQFNGPITIGPGSASHSPSILFTVTGPGSLVAPILEMVSNSDDLFVVNNHSGMDDDIGGVLFQDLQIAYASGLTAGAAIRVSNTTSGMEPRTSAFFGLFFRIALKVLCSKILYKDS